MTFGHQAAAILSTSALYFAVMAITMRGTSRIVDISFPIASNRASIFARLLPLENTFLPSAYSVMTVRMPDLDSGLDSDIWGLSAEESLKGSNAYLRFGFTVAPQEAIP